MHPSNPEPFMKTRLHRARRGFTLIELLVVIAIIAVLAAAGFAAANAAMNKARATSAKATASSLQQAVEQFYNTYGSLPNVGNAGGNQDSEIETDGGDGVELLQILLGKETNTGANSGVQNPRGIKFLEVKDGKGRRDGLAYSTDKTTVIGLYDPWGNPYNIVLDTDYNDTLEFTLDERERLNGKRVAVFSIGPDRNRGTKDDVKTWR